MTKVIAPENTPVWVNKARCKACDICASVCPAGVIAMQADPTSTLGSMVVIIEADSCIGCMECELSCPDFAIHVAEKDEFKFAKLTQDAINRQEELKNNNYRVQGK